jgi:hypothetical protein
MSSSLVLQLRRATEHAMRADGEQKRNQVPASVRTGVEMLQGGKGGVTVSKATSRYYEPASAPAL